MDKEDAFWIGNCIGVVALLATIIIFAPIKNKERQAYEAKQKAVAQAAKQKETVSASDAVRKASPIDANSIGASQAAGAAKASRQKLHS